MGVGRFLSLLSAEVHHEEILIL